MTFTDKDKQNKDIFKEIIEENWDEFKKQHPSYDIPQYNDAIEKMLLCGTMEGGYIEYRCGCCGKGTKKVAFTCKSMFCLSCAKVYVDELVSQISKMLHPGMKYRHVVLTVPEQLRLYFYRNRHDGKLLSKLIKTAYECMEDIICKALRKKVKIGCICVLQTHGRSGKYNPHVHIIMTSGGIDEKNKTWEELSYIKYDMCHKKWKYYLLRMMREWENTKEMNKLIDILYKKYPKGFVANISKGEAPKKAKGLAKYLAKYVAAPPISVRRIIKYDGKEVTYKYKDHETKAEKIETIEVLTFIGRMVQHVLPKGFKRIRYYGLQATKTFKKWKEIISEGLKKVGKTSKDTYEIVESMNYRERYKSSTGEDPLICPYCGKEMQVWEIWHPKYGVIYSEEKRIREGRYEYA